jgi:ADP-ribosyl-[dinitrogen reductase] hydrolase
MTDLADRIRAGFVAFAVGDALGVPWEGRRPDQIDPDDIDRLPQRGDWPAGATSDDTAQTLLVADYLAEVGADFEEHEFLRRLATAVETMRGAGPSTLAAVERFRATGAVQADGGATNGAAMRAQPIGWAFPVSAADRRRDVTVRLSRTTHGELGAVGSACVVSAMASSAVDAAPLPAVIETAVNEIDWLESVLTHDADLFDPLRRAADGDWHPSTLGVTLDAIDTVTAVIHVIRHADRRGLGPADAMRYAVSLGGDTDTVAAIAGGLLGSRHPDADLPWLESVALPEPEELDRLSRALADRRQSLA